MSWLETRKDGACWIACWKQNGKKMRRSTGIPVKQPGKDSKTLKRIAEQTAAAIELEATGKTVAYKACEAVRKVAEMHGEGGRIPTVREYFDAYPRTATESSERNRAHSFSEFYAYLGTGADRRIDAITVETCRSFIRHLLKKLSKGSVKQIKGYVSQVFKRAVNVDDLMNKNPFAGVDLAAEARAINPEMGNDKQQRLPFTIDEIHMMIHEFPEPWCDMVAVSWYLGGLRLSDVCLLRWDAINWRDGYIRLVEVKTKKDRSMPMIPALRKVLHRLRDEADGGEEYVFPMMAHYYMGSSRSRISTQFTAFLRARGMIPGTVNAGERKGNRHAVSLKSFHSIRHSAVSYLRGGLTGTAFFSPELVRLTIGHDNEGVERGYAHGSLDATARVLQTLSDAVADDDDTPPPAPHANDAEEYYRQRA